MRHLPGPDQDSPAAALQAPVPVPGVHRSAPAAGHLPAQLPPVPPDDPADPQRVPVSPRGAWAVFPGGQGHPCLHFPGLPGAASKEPWMVLEGQNAVRCLLVTFAA